MGAPRLCFPAVHEQNSKVSEMESVRLGIQSGARLGVYEVASPLGAGGMGEVYRARDTRLNRDVAVKVLAGEFASDPGRRARFQEEARSVAGLSHPNILALYDVGMQDGVTFMVTELVDGESLRHVQLSPRKALEIAAQIAEGLAAAHAAGVIHRDLKPDNVMVTRDGRVKVLDFGLAKLANSAEPELTGAHTEIGTIVGTAGYMAPEQVRGQAVDARTDIFAFGATLYELLSGKRAFDGETPAEIMTAILRQDPPELPASVPPTARQIAHRCLEKNPQERFQSARDLAFALRHLTGSAVSGEPPAARAPVLPRRLTFAVGGILAGVLLVGAFALLSAVGQDDGIDPVQLTRIAADPLTESAPQFSPDGQSVAYLRGGGGLTELVVKGVDALTSTALVQSDRPLAYPRWTPDGNRICYTVARDFWCVGAAGGTPQHLLREVYSPQFTQGGEGVLFVRAAADDNQPWLFRSALTGGEPQKFGDAHLPSDLAGVSPVSPDGTKLIVFGSSFRWSLKVDDGRRQVLPVEKGIRTVEVGWLPDSRHIAVAEETTNPAGSRLVIVDTESTARRLVLRSADPVYGVNVSPDGRRLVYAAGPVKRDIAEYSGNGGFVRTVAGSANLEGFPSWTPDGSRLVYRVGGPGQTDSLWLGSADGAPPTPLVQLRSNMSSAHRMSPDGGRIAYADDSGIHVLSITGGRAIRVVPPLGLVPNVCWSADGEWIWYEGGPVTLHKVRSDGGDPVPVPAALGQLVDCSPDGRWLARSGRDGRLMLTSTDGTTDRVVVGAGEFIWRGEASHLFGQGGKVLYLLNSDRRSISVRDVETGRTVRSISFDLPAEDTIAGFSVDASGARVLLTIGGNRYDLWTAEGFATPAKDWRRLFRHWEAPRQPGS